MSAIFVLRAAQETATTASSIPIEKILSKGLVPRSEYADEKEMEGMGGSQGSK